MGGPSAIFRSETLFQSIRVSLVMTVASRIVAIGRGILFARLLAASELGRMALVNNAVQLLAFVFVFGVPTGLSRYIERRRQRGDLNAFLVRTLGVSLALALAALAGGLVFQRQVGWFWLGESAHAPLTVLLLCIATEMVAFNLLLGVLHGLQMFRVSAAMELAHDVLLCGLAWIILGGWRADAVGCAIAHLAATGTVTAVFGCAMWRLLPRDAGLSSTGPESTEPPPGWGSLVRFSLGTWTAGTLQGTARSGDRFMLVHVDSRAATATLEGLGGYYLASKYGQPLYAVGNLIGAVLAPHAAKLWEIERPEEVGQVVKLTAKLTALVLTFGGACAVALGAWVLPPLVGHVPPATFEVLPAVLCATTLVSLHYVLRTYLLCRESAWQVAGVWLAALVANLLLNWWLIPALHMQGAVLASCASAALAAFAVTWLGGRTGLKLDFGTWAACGLPLALLLPTGPTAAVLAGVAVCVLATDRLLNTEEKGRLNDSWERAVSARRTRAAAS